MTYTPANYELCRIAVEHYEPGAVLTGKATVLIHMMTDVGSKKTWVSERPIPECIDVSREKMIFKKRCFFLKVDPIGLTKDDVCSGEMDFQLTVKTITEVWGQETLKQVIRTAMKNAFSYDTGVAHVTFIGAFEQNQDETWRFVGMIPMDKRLDTIIVSDVGKEVVIDEPIF